MELSQACEFGGHLAESLQTFPNFFDGKPVSQGISTLEVQQTEAAVREQEHRISIRWTEQRIEEPLVDSSKLR